LYTIIAAAVADRTPPTIQCPQSMTIKSEHCSVAVYWPEVKAYDNSGKKLLVKCSDNSGLALKTPTTWGYRVSCSARDAAGNEQYCSFFIDVEGTSH